MPFLQLNFDSPPDPEALESACFAAGALSVTLTDAADAPIFEPPLNTTPLWPQVRLGALFDAHADRAQHHRDASRETLGPSAARARLRRDRRQSLGTRMARGFQADALRQPAVDLPARAASAGAGCRRRAARSGSCLRHRNSSDDGAVSRMAGQRAARGKDGHRLRVRLGHSRHRGGEARREPRVRRRPRSAGTAGHARKRRAKRRREKN